MQQIYQRILNHKGVKKHFFICFIGILLGILIYYYLLLNGEKVEESISFSGVSAAALCGVLVGYILYGLTLKLDELVPWKNQMPNRLAIGIVSHFIISLFIVLSLFYVYNVFFILEPDFFIAYKQTLIKLSILLFILSILYTLIYFALYSYYSFARLQIETVQQERTQIELQLKALKSQISPHFLFNNLNTISSLIFEDTSKAEHYIRRLAKIYQFTLSSYHEKLVPLSKELDIIASYQYLLDIRFKNKIRWTINISEAHEKSNIPPLTLQMLVENAIKHNELTSEKPLSISIKTVGDYICVENNLTSAPQIIESFNIGLTNIKERYKLLINKEIVIDHGATFSVKLPVVA